MPNRPHLSFLPVVDLPTPTPPAGEPHLEPRHKIALLRIRRSDWSEAVLTKLGALKRCNLTRADFEALVRLGLAINKGSFHTLTSAGRWRADRIAMDFARANAMHIITYDFDPSGAPCVLCTCGFRTFRTRAIPSYASMLTRDAHHHLQFVKGR